MCWLAPLLVRWRVEVWVKQCSVDVAIVGGGMIERTAAYKWQHVARTEQRVPEPRRMHHHNCARRLPQCQRKLLTRRRLAGHSLVVGYHGGMEVWDKGFGHIVIDDQSIDITIAGHIV